MGVERSVPPTDLGANPPSPPSRWSPSSKYLLALAAVICALAVWSSISNQRGEARELKSLPVESREQLYQRVLENLRFCKSQPDDRFKRFCSAEAEFILEFPECDAECEALTRRSMPHPVR